LPCRAESRHLCYGERFLDFARNDKGGILTAIAALALLEILDQSGRHRRDPFAAAYRSQPFVRGRLDADARNVACQRACNLGSHLLNMWLQRRRFSNQGGIDVYGARIFLRQQGSHVLENFQAADSANILIRIREMMSDVAFAHCAKKRIRNRMRKHVCIRVSVESAIMRDLDSTEDEFSALNQSVYVVTNSTANHKITTLSRSRR
jgi:hypothetical protein